MSNSIELSGIFSEGYGFVPKKLMKAKDISSNTKLVLCYLLSYTGAGCTAFPQQKDMSDSLGISCRTIIRSIQEAIKNGYINKHQENRGDAVGKKNVYELLFMRDFYARDKLAHAKKSIASDKNDISQVTDCHTNNNSTNNNNNNNNYIINKFKKPTLEEVKTYIKEKGYTNVNADKWYCYYESNGWRVGKNPMRSWHGAIATWHLSEYNKSKGSAAPATDGIKSVKYIGAAEGGGAIYEDHEGKRFVKR